MPSDQIGEAVVADPGELDGVGRCGKRFERRRRHRQDLLVVAEIVHDPEARVEIVQALDVPDPLAHVLVRRRELHQRPEISFRKEVVEHVDFSHASGSSRPIREPAGV